MSILTTRGRWTPSSEDPRAIQRVVPVEIEEEVPVGIEEPNAIAWLIVLGEGTWGYADKNTVMHTYPAGLHHICQETVNFALKLAGPRSRVIVAAEKPVLARRHLRGPLSPQHLSFPSGVALKKLTESEQGEQTSELAFEHACLRCPKRYPSPEALKRHVDRNHAG